jgi:3-dehydroquinate synthase
MSLITSKMTLHSRLRDYDANFCETPEFILKLSQLPASSFIVDSNVWKNHSDGCLKSLGKYDVITVEISEEKKSLETVQDLYEQMMSRSAKKNLTVVSIGGGIIQDITGFMTSTLYRGVNWIFVPTTLLAQADSCIGSKTSLNFRHYKNSIGTFYPPKELYIHTPFLKTQDDLNYFSGLGEIAKLHLMDGEGATTKVISNLQSLKKRDPSILLDAIKSSLIIKKGYIEGDEFDTGRRNLLNFGHCFGHAIETATDFSVPHGQAVVIGMLLANSVSRSRGILSLQMEEYLANSLFFPIITVPLKGLDLDEKKVIEAMKHDKKRVGSDLPLIMMSKKHEMTKVDNLKEGEVLSALNELKAQIRKR